MKYLAPLFSLLVIMATLNASAQTPTLFDLRNDAGGSFPHYLTPFNNLLCFYASDGVNGDELWSYDGTAAPALVHNLNPGVSGSGVGIPYTKLPVFKGKMYYPADKGDGKGVELYAYDGVNPPALVADINTGTAGSSPGQFCVYGSKLYFSANTTAAGRELFSYDGTNPPVLYDLQAGSGSSSPAMTTPYQGKLIFRATTDANTAGSELHVFDTATGMASMVLDINTGKPGSDIEPIISGGGKLWFAATTPAYGYELYSYNGSSVTRVTDLAAGSLNGVGHFSLAYYNGAVYFAGTTTGFNSKLYKYDPATTTASLVSDINPGADAYVDKFTEFKGKLYFSAIKAGLGSELWVTDGTGTALVAEFNPGAAHGSPSDLTVWNNFLYLTANNSVTGTELYRISEFTGSLGVVSAAFAGDIRLFPNPATDAATLEIKLTSPQALSIQLTDMQGRSVWTNAAKEYGSGTSKVSIPLQQLAAGTYCYRLTNPTGRLMASGSLIRK